MNIAVVTVYDGLNFGSFLQAFAMKAFLEERGHHVVFVQRFSEEENLALFTTNRPEEACGEIRKIWRKLRNYTVNRKKIERENQYYRRQFPYYQEAWRQFPRVRPDELDQIDCLICGSDEIWNLNNLNIDVPFYTCAGYGNMIAKIAVAVSAGNSVRADFEKKPQVERAIREFTEILVRDLNTKDVVEKITGRKAEIVCDPTLLADRAVFREYESEVEIEGPYLLVYTYGLTEVQGEIIKEYARKKGYRIVSACMDIKIADQAVCTSPLNFAKLISEAECCVTTTFHGTIFSLLFAKRFCTVAKYPKIMDLILSVGEEGHLWNGESAEEFERMIENTVDREKLNNCLEKKKNESSAIIDEVLKNVEKQVMESDRICS